MRQSLSHRSRAHRGPWLLICGACLIWVSSCAKPLIGNSSAVIVLLDYSRSFAPFDNGDIAALGEVNKSIVQMVRVGTLPQPVKILWAAFGDNGLKPLEPCGPARVFGQTLTGHTNDQNLSKSNLEGRLTNIVDLQSWLSVCLSAVRATSQSPQQFTDISGALMFASDAAEDIREDHIIVVFTDLLEDLPPNRQVPPLKLNKAKMLLVWRPGLDDQKQPAAVSKRVEDWRNKLERAGASRVCSKASQGISEGEISSCLWH
jgi:hypothetical protein